jgi:hypothetical protein
MVAKCLARSSRGCRLGTEEDLLWFHGAAFVDRIEARARTDARFRRPLGQVMGWASPISTNVTDRLRPYLRTDELADPMPDRPAPSPRGNRAAAVALLIPAIALLAIVIVASAVNSNPSAGWFDAGPLIRAVLVGALLLLAAAAASWSNSKVLHVLAVLGALPIGLVFGALLISSVIDLWAAPGTRPDASVNIMTALVIALPTWIAMILLTASLVRRGLGRRG